MSDEPFLARWSRRKAEARETPAPTLAPEPDVPTLPDEERGTSQAPADIVTGTRAEPTPTELPSLDSLRGLQSEYREFLKPDVDPGTQRAALKKLFGDPHFNQMDGLDVYIDDYGKFEPMSAAIAASLAANKYLRVVDHLLSEQPEKRAAAPEALEGETSDDATVISESTDLTPDSVTIDPPMPITDSADATGAADSEVGAESEEPRQQT